MIIDYRYIVSCTPSNGINNMNIIKTEIPFIGEAKTTDCNNRKNRNITYHFMESAHPTCLDKEELLQAQLKACQRLLRLPYEEENDKDIIESCFLAENAHTGEPDQCQGNKKHDKGSY